MNIKPIETHYKGYRFRSRLEARWAVLFDALNIKWEYEKEGFDMEGERYLPDFWLPGVAAWVEIKPFGKPKKSEIEKCKKLAERNTVYIFDGEPGELFDTEGSKFYAYGKMDGAQDVEEIVLRGMFFLGIIDEKIASLIVGPNQKQNGHIEYANLAAYAIKKSRSARFEFGENG